MLISYFIDSGRNCLQCLLPEFSRSVPKTISLFWTIYPR